MESLGFPAVLSDGLLLTKGFFCAATDGEDRGFGFEESDLEALTLLATGFFVLAVLLSDLEVRILLAAVLLTVVVLPGKLILFLGTGIGRGFTKEPFFSLTRTFVIFLTTSILKRTFPSD